MLKGQPRSEPFAWVLRGVYIGLPPGGTMVIRLGAAPAVSLSGHRLIRRLLGPADWWAPPTGLVRSRQAASAAGGSCRLLITVAVLLMTRASSWSRGNTPRRLAGDHYCHSSSHLVNGVWAPGEEPADSRGPTPDGSDLWRTGRLLGSRWPVGPAAQRSYRQAVLGTGFGPPVLMLGLTWQQCNAA